MDNTEINGNEPSPTTDSTKKSYDVDFLNLLKNSPFSKVKPTNILSDIWMDSTQRVPSEMGRGIPAGMRPNNEFLPGFATKGARNTLPNRRSQGKPSLRPNTSMGTPRPNLRHVSLSLRSDVKLNETENAWRPSRMRTEDLEEEQKETQEILKKFRSVLNKLTPQKFDTLISQVRDLKIDSLERLKGVINLVFEKAIEEPNFSVTYALMCKELEQIKVAPTGEEKPASFRTLIIGRCQEEFLKGDNQDNQADEKQKEIENCTDPEKKKELQLLLEEEKRKIRMRAVGNVRFIGELFKQGIITNNKIMLNCIEILLMKIEEETLECLCKLLTTIGKDLETVHNKDLSKYFAEMQAIVDKKKGQNVSSRVRFMIQDVIDLRLKKWVPRKIVSQSNPKTIDQIAREAEKEQMLTYQNNYSSPSTPRQDDRMDRNDRYDRPMNKRGASKSVNNDDGWTQAPMRNSRTKTTYTIDRERLSKMTSATPIPQISLSPAIVSWAGGASSTNNFSPRNTNNVKKTTSTESRNMYNVLQDQAPEPSQAAVAPKKTGKRKSQLRGRPSTMRSFSMEYTTISSNEETTYFGDDDTGKIHSVLTKCQEDTVYSIMDKLDRFLIQKDVAVDVIIKEMILWAVEFGKQKNVNVLGDVTGRLVHNKAISKEKFIEVFKKVIDTSFDLFLEGSENSWDLLAAFLWGHLIKDHLTMPEIHTILSKIVQIGKGYEFMVAFFTMKTDAKAKALWEDGKMKLSDWFGEDKEEKFRKSVTLQCFGQQHITDPSVAIQELMTLMKAKTPASKIEEWIKASISNPEEIWFIRALTEAVYHYVLVSSENAKPRFDDDQTRQRLDSYYPLLITFIGNKHNPELELHCLYAIQRLLHKLEHPMNISLHIFEELFDSGEVVSNEVFWTWEVSQDPLEQEGKGVMLKSLTSFFTALKSCDDSSEEA